MSSSESKSAQVSLNEPKLAKIGLTEPKRTQKTLNIFKMILYGLKMGLNEWVQMCKPINELRRDFKWPQKSLNVLKYL